MNRGHKQTDLIIMDFAKAFDKVPHGLLFHKLEYYGIRGSTHKWINSWLSGRTQQVVLDGQASDPVPVLSGVPQGSVLGPVLFLIFITDLLDNIRSSVRLFADDCVLYRNIHSLQDCLALQEDLTSLGKWEADWQMKFNVAKCHSMKVTRHQHHKQILFDYSLHNQTLENIQSAKYLVITITDTMDWGQHVSEISSKATKTLGFLRRNLAFAPRSTKEVAYKTMVRPKLEYTAPLWSPHSKLQNNQIEKVQRTAARWTCRRWRNTSSVGVMLDELEWPSLEARRHQTYNDALKSFPFPLELFHIEIVCLLLWPIPSPQRSLGHSILKQKFSQKFLCFLCCFCVVFELFLFFILSKFPNSQFLV